MKRTLILVLAISIIGGGIIACSKSTSPNVIRPESEARWVGYDTDPSSLTPDALQKGKTSPTIKGDSLGYPLSFNATFQLGSYIADTASVTYTIDPLVPVVDGNNDTTNFTTTFHFTAKLEATDYSTGAGVKKKYTITADNQATVNKNKTRLTLADMMTKATSTDSNINSLLQDSSDPRKPVGEFSIAPVTSTYRLYLGDTPQD